MENQIAEEEKINNEIYDYAANLMIQVEKNSSEVIASLIDVKGLDEQSASKVVLDLEQHIKIAKKEAANKDMLYGALWCIGGTIATMADIGFIFWGAIVFGGIQFFKGLVNSVIK
ncbi:hypothetical protein [Wenyingzhuangia sp. IMCC45574]